MDPQNPQSPAPNLEAAPPDLLTVLSELKARCVLAVYAGLAAFAGPNITSQMNDVAKQTSGLLFVELSTTLLPATPESHQEVFVQAYLDAAKNIIGKNGLLQSVNRLVGQGQSKGACRVIAEQALATLAGLDDMLRDATRGPVTFLPTTQPQVQQNYQTLQQQPRQNQPQGRPLSPAEELMQNLGLTR